MQRQRLFWKAVATAAFIIAFSVPIVRAEGETPYEAPSARIGRPPGVSNTDVPPSTTDDAAATAAPEPRMSRPSGKPAEVQPSIWAAFLSWLQEQALRIATR